MNKTMRGFVKPARSAGAELWEVPIPDIESHEVLIRVRATSLCGTDLHIYNLAEQHFAVTPMIFGHEYCGDVVAVGSDVQRV